ncbi:MAG TPA: hypothetical protein VIM99_14050, partial [Blastocatellia bacterium]
QSGGMNPGTPAANQPPASDSARPDEGDLFKLTQQLNSSSSWFFWIAGLSVINSLIAVFGGNLRFIFGLGVTSVADALSFESGAIAKTAGFVFTLLTAGLFVIFGVLARKHFHWALIVGMVVYALDGLLLLAVSQDYLGVAFHAFVLFLFSKGVSASKKLSELKRP